MDEVKQATDLTTLVFTGGGSAFLAWLVLWLKTRGKVTVVTESAKEMEDQIQSLEQRVDQLTSKLATAEEMYRREKERADQATDRLLQRMEAFIDAAKATNGGKNLPKGDGGK